jgi:hypothetical protein
LSGMGMLGGMGVVISYLVAGDAGAPGACCPLLGLAATVRRTVKTVQIQSWFRCLINFPPQT